MVSAHGFQQFSSRTELAVVAVLWQNIDKLLLSGCEAVDESVWLLMNSLPSVEELETGQLPQLAQLHLSSAASLMTTIRLLAPSTFPDGASSPDEELLSRLDGSRLDMVSCLIELQLFHLQRAALLAARIRRCSKHTHSVSNLGRCCSTGHCSKSAQADP